jgi:hypothetical protein
MADKSQLRRPAMQAIETKYIGPTDTKGGRISARCEARRIVRDVDHSLGIEERHTAVARELINLLGWHGHWICGAVPSNPNGYIFACGQRHDYDHLDEKGSPWKGPTEGFDVWPEMAEA